jgi:hypothetical protein
MSKCNIVRIKGGCYDTEPPRHVVYLDDLPGLSLSTLAAVAPADLLSAVALVEQKNDLAARRLSSLLRNALRRRGIRLDFAGDVWQYCNIQSTAAPAGVESIRINWDFFKSKLGRLHIQQLTVKAAATGSTTLQIKSEGGAVLWSEAVNLIADEKIIVTVDKYFSQRFLFVSSANNALPLYGASCGGAVGCCGLSGGIAPPIIVSGWTGDGTTTAAPGISIKAALVCDVADLVCCFTRELKEAILYATGAEVAKEIAAPSSRFNYFSDVSKEWANEAAAMWSEEAETLLTNELELIAEKLRLDYCFSCSGHGFSSIPILPG